LAAHQDLAVVGDLHLDTRDRLADGSLFRAERMIQGHDRCGLGQAVSLNHDESELGPERFERWFERGGADDKCPELETECAMDPAISPPAPRDVLFLRRGELVRAREEIAVVSAFRRTCRVRLKPDTT